jgi:hypothetical protein
LAESCPELVGCMLVVVVRPGLSDHAIPHVEHQGLLAVKPAPLPFALGDVQPDGHIDSNTSGWQRSAAAVCAGGASS